MLLIKGAIPGSNNDYVVIREAKKLPKGSDRAKRKLAVRTAVPVAATTGKGKPAAPAKADAKKK